MQKDSPSARQLVQISRRFGDGGGASGVAINLERQLILLGYECHRVSLETAKKKFLSQYRGTRLRQWLLTFRDILFFTTWATFLFHRKRGPAGAISICHGDALAGDIYVNHGLLRAVAESRGGPLIFGLKNPLAGFILIREAIRFRLRIHKVIINLTPSDDEEFNKFYPNFRGDRRVITNGVDTVKFHARVDGESIEARKLLGLPQNRQLVLFVGHEFRRKGLPWVIEAMADLPEHVCLVVVGGNRTLVEAAAQTASKFGVSNQVIFAGTVVDSEPFFRACDVFCLPSQYETGPLVLLEALAAGLPAVVTAVGLGRVLIKQGVNGFVVHPKPKDISDALSNTLRDTQQWKRMSEAAVQSAQPHSWRSKAIQYAELVDELASRIVR